MNPTPHCATALLLAALSWPAVSAPTSDTPLDYSHAMALTVKATQGVVQLRLPQAVYLHAHSPDLDDVRVFDAAGTTLPFALPTAPKQTQTSHRSVPLTLFPLMTTDAQADGGAKADLDVSTGSDGHLLSVTIHPDRHGAAADKPARLAGLVLDMRPERGEATGDDAPLVDALHFTLPAGVKAYNAQVWLEVSDDLKQWDNVGAAELHWLVNSATQTLANDRLEFEPRRFRYARLTWRNGEPVQFASVDAELSIRTETAPVTEQLLLHALPGKVEQDLIYPTPVAIPAQAIGLDFGDANAVLPVTLGSYVTLPARQIGETVTWQFLPMLTTTFYRITQGGQARSSGNLALDPTHSTQWVLRMQAPSSVRPMLRLTWTPATLIFLADGKGPYTLAFGREHAEQAARDVTQVAPGFAPAELLALEQAGAGALREQHPDLRAADDSAQQAATSAHGRMIVLWGALLLGVAVLGTLVWRLLIQMKAQPSSPDA